MNQIPSLNNNVRFVFLPLVIILGWLFVWPSSLAAQVNALFSVSQTSGCDSLEVLVVNQSSGEGTITYTWNLGNGGLDFIDPNDTMVVFYDAPGSYSLLLHAESSLGGSDVHHVTVQVHASPKADFSVNTRQACVPYTISFSNQSVEGDAEIVRYQYTMGDGTTSSLTNPAHQYTTPGWYDVHFLVEDENGCLSDQHHEDYLYMSAQPVAEISSDQTWEGCKAPYQIYLQNTSQVDSNMSFSYQWDFGDGSVFAGRQPDSVRFDDYQTYDVRLQIFNSTHGCAASTMQAISVLNVQAGFDIIQDGTFFEDGDTLCPGEITLKNTGGQVTFAWQVNQHTYFFQNELNALLDTGWRILQQEAWRQTCRDTLRKEVYVEPVRAFFTLDADYSCQFPFDIQVRDSSFHVATWTWLFEQDSSLTGKDPGVYTVQPHAYDTFSHTLNLFEIPVSLTVTSPKGCQDTYENQASVRLPVARFMPDRLSGCAGLSVSFSDSSRSGEPIDTWHWITGDGDVISTDTGFYQHTYDSIGSHQVRLVIENHAGCRDTSYAISIKVGETLQPDFAVPDTICNNTWITLRDSTPGNLTQQWRYTSDAFRLQGCAAEPSPRVWVDVDSVACYDVSLAVTNNGCQTDTTKHHALCVTGPIADFTYTSVCEDPSLFHFHADVSADVTLFYWRIEGVEMDTNMLQADYRFPDAGMYEVSLLAVHDTGMIERRHRVHVYHPVAAIDAPSDVCVGDSVLFSSVSSSGLLDSCSWKPLTWYFDSLSAPVMTQESEAVFFFRRQGIYEILLEAKALNGCRDTARHSIKVRKPVASFVASDSIACSPRAIVGLQNTLEDTTVVSWQWHLPDDRVVIGDTAISDTLSITEDANYRPQLLVKDAYGCADTLSKTLSLKAPVAELRMADRFLCEGDSALLMNLSYPAADSVVWLINDSMRHVSTVYASQHLFPVGSYALTMIVYASICSDTVNNTDFFSVQKADADFAVAIYDEGQLSDSAIRVSDTTFYCYPMRLQYQYLQAGDDPVQATWFYGEADQFGDGLADTASYIYSEPGMYMPSLAIATSNGCRDTTSLSLRIEGPEAKAHVSANQLCKGESLALAISDEQEVDSVIWSLGDGQVSTQASTNHFYRQSGLYPLALQLSNDHCTVRKTLDTIRVHPDSAGFVLPEPIMCRDVALSVSPHSAHAASLRWTLGDGTVLHNENPSGHLYAYPDTFVITLYTKSINGCLDSLSRSLVVLDYPEVELSSSAGQNLCKGASTRIRANTYAAVPTTEYRWSDSSLGRSDSVEVFPLEDAFYHVTVSNQYGCSGSDTIALTVIPEPIVNTSLTEHSIIVGETVTLAVSADDPEAHYSWLPIQGLHFEYEDSATVKAQPLETTTYQVEVITPCFVHAYAFHVEVKEQYRVSLPQAFTPNGDGVNDQVYVRGWGIKQLLEFSVYNRFGNRIFFTDDLKLGWDGTYQGKQLPVDSYTYYVRVLTFEDQEIDASGMITIMR